MQADPPPINSKTKKCRKCSQCFPVQKFSMHLMQCDHFKNKSWRYHSRDKDEQMCQNCGQFLMEKDIRQHERVCCFEESCQYCKQKYPEQMLYNHEIMCRKNPTAKAIRKQYPSSSDEPDSSDQQQQWVMDQDYYYYKKSTRPQKNRRHNSSSEEEITYQEKSQKKRQSFFHHHPRRQYRLSQSSSEEDQHQKYWRTYHQSFSQVPTQFYVRSLRTDLEGITIVVSSEGPNGQIIRRTVWNQQTGSSTTISDHRYQRHYQSHVIQPQEVEQNGATLVISNTVEIDPQNLVQLLQIANEVVGLTEEEISALQRGKWEGKEDQKCIICYSQYQKNDQVMKLKCNHYFHFGCVRQWLVQNQKCPLCKASQK